MLSLTAISKIVARQCQFPEINMLFNPKLFKLSHQLSSLSSLNFFLPLHGQPKGASCNHNHSPLLVLSWVENICNNHGLLHFSVIFQDLLGLFFSVSHAILSGINQLFSSLFVSSQIYGTRWSVICGLAMCNKCPKSIWYLQSRCTHWPQWSQISWAKLNEVQFVWGSYVHVCL